MVKKIGKAISYIFFIVAILLGIISIYAFISLCHCSNAYCTNYFTISGSMALMLAAIVAITGLIIRHYSTKKIN